MDEKNIFVRLKLLRGGEKLNVPFSRARPETQDSVAVEGFEKGTFSFSFRAQYADNI